MEGKHRDSIAKNNWRQGISPPMEGVEIASRNQAAEMDRSKLKADWKSRIHPALAGNAAGSKPVSNIPNNPRND